jgi:predicted SprT family Zn-dependent metalloprotease
MLSYARTRFNHLKTEHAPGIDIKFKFNKSKSRSGVCLTNPLEIQLSEYFINSPVTTKQKIVDVILHELAHAIVGVHHMHDDVWKGVARDMGCTSNVCSGPFLMKKDYTFSIRCVDGCDTRKLKLTKKYLARPHICGPHKKMLKVLRI